MKRTVDDAGFFRLKNITVWIGLGCAVIGLAGCMLYIGMDWINPGGEDETAGLGGGALVLTTGKSLNGAWIQAVGLALFPLLFLIVLVGPTMRRIFATVSTFIGLCYSWVGLTFVIPEAAIEAATKKYPPTLTGEAHHFGMAGLLLVLGSILIVFWPGQAQRLQSTADKSGWIVVPRGEDPTTAH
ncbi:MAG: hypothetical protein ACRCWS_09030 [Propionibacteriaceae bacterium]